MISLIPTIHIILNTYLIFLSGNGVTYAFPTSDEWYRVASTPTNGSAISTTTALSTKLYLPSLPASPLGCADQYQLYNAAMPEDRRCRPLASLTDAISGAAPLFGTRYLNYVTFGAQAGNPRTDSEARFNYFAARLATRTLINILLTQLKSAGLISQRNFVTVRWIRGWNNLAPGDRLIKAISLSRIPYVVRTWTSDHQNILRLIATIQDAGLTSRMKISTLLREKFAKRSARTVSAKPMATRYQLLIGYFNGAAADSIGQYGLWSD
ncbi:hypothetical protein NPX13_g6085 [Xylaria arbuscula]|uniref:Uncharacterized protein n=1 Tax=Xylaria arbuscula TaxID=114810 RepID=A0A9W8NCW6_9PEZI|nr:hypothetical protein NPX13_g6085 [Xylaria arbuscula]